MQQEEKYIYMTETPVPRLIGELAVPTIISMLVTSFYNMADTFFVGKLNTQSTAAVGIVFSVMAIIQALGFFFGHGSSPLFSRIVICILLFGVLSPFPADCVIPPGCLLYRRQGIESILQVFQHDAHVVVEERTHRRGKGQQEDKP